MSRDQVAVYGGLVDRVHDLLLCGVDPSLVDLSICAQRPDNDADSEEDSSDEEDSTYDKDVWRSPYDDQQTEVLLKATAFPWKPKHHAFLYGPQFRACIASLCLIKVNFA